MESHLRRMRHQFVATPDCLALAKACCDNIDDLKPFKRCLTTTALSPSLLTRPKEDHFQPVSTTLVSFFSTTSAGQVVCYSGLIFHCSPHSDPRPTFLFWARGRPVALLRGANRPLLTRLVEQEVSFIGPLFACSKCDDFFLKVEVEAGERPRSGVDIDFRSHRVIQCEGELALLDDDEVRNDAASKDGRNIPCRWCTPSAAAGPTS